jgi:hypothetical protein
MVRSYITSIFWRGADKPRVSWDTSALLGGAFQVRSGMRIRLFLIGIGISVCAWVLSAQNRTSAPRPAPQPRSAVLASRLADKAPQNECLQCHGPFAKLVEASTRYVAPSGETTSPHRFVPHNSKLEEDVPECNHCHTAHPLDPLPAKGSIDLSKVGVKWCYEVCHHEKNLTSCKECHP